ncbi:MULTISPECIES: TadE/TadG family type IV pilus assembly protein [unclassified Mesorhizobium]|uniref:TadE/TadG family type IV pilus assembly protein n=1 Tax=unclassified Mesorhizobium TaxID=325217 RepID=UPI001CCDEEA0|nr:MULTISPECIES: pilus assembly protein TadG-related protein [unclassified Mesorhizobium]MBZ9737980.1 pilus assembly protein TadG-related protein [Mesorhizobium sp. CO1-1-4]MBZ9801833.1 pilus assembly protein TadG-related protein [Mesorhizobium sp. ES1-6]
MFRVLRGFARSRSGSMMPLFLVSLMPLIAVIGFSVDYTGAVQTKSNQQQALDAAILTITTMDTTSTLAQRQGLLQDSFAANGGQGAATLTNFVAGTATTATTAQATASFAMPTVFMSIARISTVPIAVASAVSKPPALVNATFKVTGVSGYWNKTMTLYGTQFGATQAKSLMTIDYVYGGTGDRKGYGTTTVSVITTDSRNRPVSTVVQKQVCQLVDANTPAGAVIQTDTFQTKYYCVDTMYPADGTGASIDVSQMGGLYLQMNVPSGNPKNLATNDAATSDRLYTGVMNPLTNKVDYTETATGQIVDIFSIVPCGTTGYQAWEDGGSAVPAPVGNADFFYNVTGKCDYNKRPSETALTQ